MAAKVYQYSSSSVMRRLFRLVLVTVLTLSNLPGAFAAQGTVKDCPPHKVKLCEKHVGSHVIFAHVKETDDERLASSGKRISSKLRVLNDPHDPAHVITKERSFLISSKSLEVPQIEYVAAITAIQDSYFYKVAEPMYSGLSSPDSTKVGGLFMLSSVRLLV
ncbi:hypothetical protein [Bythopirellula goksoeyrii]|uniref:Uncharacterized protein n=1 Tax=Bythopirellula goksoeyrii TaxID=1400387 RepID=A0A5B9QE07_9BACT|nr:hypothetical protein [Bythopirellula goksoeyrii]QEG35855.1 hypothetical protein Pr1d_31610 [Bythopirellula goksoeyrii]